MIKLWWFLVDRSSLPQHQFRSNWVVDAVTGVYSAAFPSPTGIAADPALTSHGVVQAEELSRHLMTLDPPIEAVYSSPYYRCLQTIDPFIELHKQNQDGNPDLALIRPEYGLSEWFGSAPFEHPRPASPQVLKDMFPAYDDDYVSALTPSRKGETLAQLHQRVATAMQTIIDRCDADGKRAVVLCTHAAVVIVLGRILSGHVPESVEVEDFRAFTCGLSVYRRRASSTWKAGALTAPAGQYGASPPCRVIFPNTSRILTKTLQLR